MEINDMFDKVTIVNKGKYLVLLINDKMIKCQIDLILKQSVKDLAIITVSFRVPNENITFLDDKI